MCCMPEIRRKDGVCLRNSIVERQTKHGREQKRLL